MESRQSEAQSVSDLDLDVSRRQAFGASHSKPDDLEDQLGIYWSGELHLPPQPIWKGDPTNWTADPFGDRNWRFQHHTLRWLNPLKWAALVGNELARDEWLRVVRSWSNENIPASQSKSDFAWADMADGNRAIQLSLGAPLVAPSETWFVETLKYHRDWLMDPNNIVGKNHGLHQHSGLLVLGAVLRDQAAVDTAVGRMRVQFESTFDSQGANDEGSSVYHQHNMIWWTQAWKRADQEGITTPERVQQRLNSAATVLAHISLPDGQIPQIGDASRGKVQKGLSKVTDYVASQGITGKAPKDASLVLDRGYILSRSGWGKTRSLSQESHMVIRHGENMRGHSHNDRGSVHIYAGGHRWLVDSGFFSYNSGTAENIYLKSREAHNVASILGRKHDPDAVVELVSSNINDKFHDFLLLDRGYENHNLYRRVIYFKGPDCWMVIDKAESEESARIVQNWFVEPGVTAQVRDIGFRLAGAGGASFGMYWLGRGTRLSMKRAGEGSLEGWVGTKWRTLEAGTKLTAKSVARRPHIVTLMGSHNPTPLSIVDSRVAMNEHISLHLVRGSSEWKITVNRGKITLKLVGE